MEHDPLQGRHRRSIGRTERARQPPYAVLVADDQCDRYPEHIKVRVKGEVHDQRAWNTMSTTPNTRSAPTTPMANR